MKISDIFRKLADVIDTEQDPGRPDPKLQNPAELSAVTDTRGNEAEVLDDQDLDNGSTQDEVMIPPLQLKMELLKRAVGVDNVYDDSRADEVEDDCGHDGELNLARIKQMAGIPVAAIGEMADDDIIDN